MNYNFEELLQVNQSSGVPCASVWNSHVTDYKCVQNFDRRIKYRIFM